MKMRKEYGPSDFHKMISGLRQAAEQICREEFNKIVVPAPVQMRFPFMDDKQPERTEGKPDVLPATPRPTTGDALALTDHDRNFLSELRIEVPDDARWPSDGDTADPEAAL
jgi:hypothetical protein